uniref:Glycosyl transferase family 25 domain-containing protein n=1 Tax=viral metagenome TaxID=1070528 RepID=A0A6C0KJG5_9ZZZZ
MNFNTYYINLEKDKSRNENTIQELKKTNLTYSRFQGINGESVMKQSLIDENIISPFCKALCTNKTIGCGVSHLMLYKHIKENDTNDYALILEDDIIVTKPELNYHQEIEKIIHEYNTKKPNWQIIRLHSMGFNMGSAAAQIINLKYIETLSSMKLYYHIDIQQTLCYLIVNLNTLFDTRDKEIIYNIPINNVYIDNQKLGFYLNNHVCYLFNIIIYCYHVLFFIIFIMIYITIIRPFSYSKRRNKIPL